MIIISDTSPLVCLLHLNKINLLKDLFINVIIPTAVYTELINAKTINDTFLQSNPFIQIKSALNQKEVLKLRNVLDAGESEAIVLSKELNADLLLIDEDRGRKFAIKYGLTIKGVLGVLLQAKEKGLIHQIKPLIERLQTEINFRINKNLLQKILIEANEL
jgi:predicted nucleic acid-binding protein